MRCGAALLLLWLTEALGGCCDGGAFIIALHPPSSWLTAHSAARFLGLPNVTVVQAVNGTQALHLLDEDLALYTRYLLHFHARHDHMQLSTAPMLGCLLSHMRLWASVRENQTIAVFEEDAVFDALSGTRFDALLADVADYPWDILMLESGSLMAGGPWKPIGRFAATCAKQPCSWMGTRGYLLTHRGARLLLRHARPVAVQVDALIGLVAAFTPDFRMYWTRSNVVHLRYTHISTIWEGCIKCYMPASPVFFIYCVLALAAGCVLGRTRRHQAHLRARVLWGCLRGA
jgi:GR25 family glycosyltransferase involved in LPS biosynthesis